MAKRKVLVADEPKEYEQISTYLEKTGYQTACASNGKQALQLIDHYSPELLLLGLTLPDIKGIELCQTIRQKSYVPIIMLSSKSQEGEIIAALRKGADDYLPKPFNPDLLLAKIEAILRRIPNAPLKTCGLIFDDGVLSINEETHEIKVRGALVHLTPNEFKILVTLAGYTSKIFTRDELIKLICGEQYQGSSRVIDTHVKCIRQKINDDWQNPKYVKTVHSLGYRFSG